MPSFNIKDVIGTQNAILQKFGLQLFEQIDPFISNGEFIDISFAGLANLTSGFANASFGNLYKKYGNDLSQLIRIVDLDDVDWKEKLEDAKTLALNPNKAKIIDEAIADLFS
jgi:hypothetical protein